MTKIDAVKEIIADSRSNRRPSKTSLKRVRRAGKSLGLSPAEQIELEQYLDYRIWGNAAELYSQFTE